MVATHVGLLPQRASGGSSAVGANVAKGITGTPTEPPTQSATKYIGLKGNICVITDLRKNGQDSQGEETTCVFYKTTYEKVVGTVHLVTNESFFVA